MEHYLDNAATTAVLPCAREAAVAAMDNFGNPGSLHARGTAARKVLDDSRKALAAALGCKPACVTFTSGGSESTNTALRGAVLKNKHVGKHIVSTQIEHDATLNTLKALQNQGFEVTLLDVSKGHNITAQQVKDAIREDTCLVTCMYANNEIGSVLPIAQIGAVCKQAGVPFHTDAVQAVGHIAFCNCGFYCKKKHCDRHYKAVFDCDVTVVAFVRGVQNFVCISRLYIGKFQ